MTTLIIGLCLLACPVGMAAMMVSMRGHGRARDDRASEPREQQDG